MDPSHASLPYAEMKVKVPESKKEQPALPVEEEHNSAAAEAELRKHKYQQLIIEDGDVFEESSGIMPGTEDFSGVHNFELYLAPDKSKCAWLYSSVLQKLYIDINKVVKLQFKMKPKEIDEVNSTGGGPRLWIRGVPVFSSPEYLQEPVSRCPVHIMADKNGGQPKVPWLYHVLRVDHPDAKYMMNRKSKRYSVGMEAKPRGVNKDTVEILYKFSCKTSCSYGLNRRPVHVIFTLEDEAGRVLGRRKLMVKVCSCPKRDLNRDETVLNTNSETVGRKRRVKEADNGGLCASMEVHSPPTKTIKVERTDEQIREVPISWRFGLDANELVDPPIDHNDTRTFIIPEMRIRGRRAFITSLQAVHSNLLGLAVRYDDVLNLHENIFMMLQLLKAAQHDRDSNVAPNQSRTPSTTPSVGGSPQQALQDQHSPSPPLPDQSLPAQPSPGPSSSGQPSPGQPSPRGGSPIIVRVPSFTTYTIEEASLQTVMNARNGTAQVEYVIEEQK